MTLYELESIEEWGKPSPAGWVLVRAYARPATIDYEALWRIRSMLPWSDLSSEFQEAFIFGVDAALGGNE